MLFWIGIVFFISALGAVAAAFHFHYPGAFIVPVLLFIFIASHAIGQGAAIRVFISEIFLFLMFMMVLQLLWVIFEMIETKGVLLEAMERKLSKKTGKFFVSGSGHRCFINRDITINIHPG